MEEGLKEKTHKPTKTNKKTHRPIGLCQSYACTHNQDRLEKGLEKKT